VKSRHGTAADELTIARAAAVFGHAIAHVVQLARLFNGATRDLEVSVDETSAATTPFEHLFLAVELRRLGVELTSLAPRFPGRWEKALDVDGDFGAIRHAVRAHAAIAAEHGPYKLSIHSGSDKFSVYALLAEETGGVLHVKTSGTSYLEALRVVASADPELFREILAVARARFELDRASYELSAEAQVPPADGDLAALLDDPGARQGLHVTYGAVLSDARVGPALVATLNDAADEYARVLEVHLGRHLSLLQ
jgi:hypothetical protein